MPVDFYELLGVERDAKTVEIEWALRRRAREYHPDINDDERATAQFTVVRKAYEALTDDAERAGYDRMGHGMYIEKRLDGLTKFRHPGKADEQAGSSGSGSADAGGRSGSSGSSTGRSFSSMSSFSSSSGRSSSSSSSSRSFGRVSSSSSIASSSWSGRSRHSGSASLSCTSGSSSRTTGASQSSAASGASRGRTRNTQSNRTGTNGRFERERDGSELASVSTSGGTNPFWFGWGVSLGALLAYLGGLAWHLSGDGAGFVTTLVSLDTAAPATASLASSPLSVPSVVTLQTVAATPTVVVLPVAAALLAVSVAGVIARFGHAWTTWVYAPAATISLALVVAGMVGVGRPVAVDFLGFTVCPLLGAGGFVVDAGWYLFASWQLARYGASQQVAASEVMACGPPSSTIFVARDRLLRGPARSDLDSGAIGRVLVTYFDLDHIGTLALLSLHDDVPIHLAEPDASYLTGASKPSPRSLKGIAQHALAAFVEQPTNPMDVVRDGDELGGFVAYRTPGHTPGHTVLVHEDHGVGFVGDQVREPNGSLGLLPGFIATDAAESRRSVRAFAARCPPADVVTVDHGEPVTEYGYGTLERLAGKL